MRNPTEAPAAQRPSSLADELAELELEDQQDPEGAVPAEGTEGEPPPTGPDASAEGEDGQDAELALEGEQPEGEAQPAEQVPAWQPPEGGEPFAFRVDGREVAVPGAQRYEHGIYVPADAWNGVVQQHLADRGVWQQQRQAYERQIAELNPDAHPVVLQAQATVQAFKELLDKGPLEVAKWLDQYERNRPLLEAQIQNQTLAAQLEQRTRGSQQQEQEQLERQVWEAMPGYLEQHIEAAVSQTPELAELKGVGAAKLRETIWPYWQLLFIQAPPDRDLPEHNLRRGQIGVNRGVLSQLLGQQAAHQAELKRLQKAARHNAAATGRAPVAPTVTTRGRPAPAGRAAPQPASAQEWKDNFLASDPLAED
jgi:hypothetical protein